jgi:hypothetical protein
LAVCQIICCPSAANQKKKIERIVGLQLLAAVSYVKFLLSIIATFGFQFCRSVSSVVTSSRVVSRERGGLHSHSSRKLSPLRLSFVSKISLEFFNANNCRRRLNLMVSARVL